MGASDLSTYPVKQFLGPLTLRAASAGENPLLLRGATGQTANVLESRDAANTLQALIGPAGTIKSGAVGVTLPSRFALSTEGATNVGMIIRASASQSANLAEFQNSAGTIMGRITSEAGLSFITTGTAATSDHVLQTGSGNSINFVTGVHRVSAASSSLAPLQVIGRSGQSGNLFEVRNSASTVLASVSALGVVSGSRGSFINTDAAQRALTVRGMTSQSVNLVEIQDSAATVLTGITQTGRLLFNAFDSTAALGAFAGSVIVTIGANNYRLPLYVV